MLGRKIGTLGKVVDGTRDASLNADVAEDGEKITPSGLSVQDELQNFFADTVTDVVPEKPKAPVKGTIMSFFKKQKKPITITITTRARTRTGKQKEGHVNTVSCKSCNSRPYYNSQPFSEKRRNDNSNQVSIQEKGRIFVFIFCSQNKEGYILSFL